jgi:cysteine desulfuration protein SufE
MAESQSSPVSTSSNEVEARGQRLVEEFSRMSGWEERYKKLIDRGKKMPAFPPELVDEKYKVKGCQSQVWLHATLSSEKRVILQADSDAMIVKGLAAVLLDVYSNAKPEDILKASPQFLKDLGFEGHLSPSRANGLYAMLKQILYYAQAYQALIQMGRA